MNVWIHTYFFSHNPSTFCFSAPHWTDDLHWADNAYFQISTYGLNMHCYNYWKLFNFSLDAWYFPSETKQQLSQTKHSRPANASWPLSSFGIILRTLYLLHLVKTKQNKQKKKKHVMFRLLHASAGAWYSYSCKQSILAGLLTMLLHYLWLLIVLARILLITLCIDPESSSHMARSTHSKDEPGSIWKNNPQPLWENKECHTLRWQYLLYISFHYSKIKQ